MFNKMKDDLLKESLRIESVKYQHKTRKRLTIAEANHRELDLWLKQNLTERKRLEFEVMINRHNMRLQVLNNNE